MSVVDAVVVAIVPVLGAGLVMLAVGVAGLVVGAVAGEGVLADQGDGQNRQGFDQAGMAEREKAPESGESEAGEALDLHFGKARTAGGFGQ